MKTVKMSAKEIKGLGQFKAISGTGKVAEFTIENDKAINVETGKALSVDSLRRSWEIVVAEEAQITAEEVVAEVQAEEAQAEETLVGKVVRTENGEIGTVIDIHNNLATVVTAETELGENADTLEVVEVIDIKATENAQAEKTTAKRTDQASANSEQQKQFLTALLAEAQAKEITRAKETSTKDYIRIKTDAKDCIIVAGMNKKAVYVTIDIKGEMTRIDEAFKAITDKAEELQAQFTEELEFINKKGVKRATISIKKEISTTEADVEWAIATAIKFNKVFNFAL